ncbi:MAG: PAS domain-containing sensor histidine kinase [Pseudomonadota bacterium]
MNAAGKYGARSDASRAGVRRLADLLRRISVDPPPDAAFGGDGRIDVDAAIAFRRAQLSELRRLSGMMLGVNAFFALSVIANFGADHWASALIWGVVVLGYVCVAAAPLLPGGRKKPAQACGERSLERYERTLAKTFWLSMPFAFAWGLAPALFHAHASSSEMMVLGGMIGAMCVGSVFGFASMPRVALSFVSLAVFPVIATGLIDPRVSLALLAPVAMLPLVCALILIGVNRRFRAAFCDRRALEERNATVSLLLRDFSAHTRDWLWQTDARCRLTFASERVEEILGLDPVESGVTLLRAIDKAGGAPETIEALATSLRSKRPFEQIVTALSVGGTGNRRWYRFSGAPIHDDAGRFIGFRGVARDVTDTQRALIEMRAARDAAEQANRTKSRFIASAGHELRTPMNAILGFSDLIAADHLGLNPPEEYKGYAADIHAAGDHLLGLINDLLDAALIEEGRLTLADDAINADTLADEARSLCSRLLREKGAEIYFGPALASAELRIDRRRIRQILVNLISNAAKYSGASPKIEIDLRPRERGVDLIVSDHGEGLSEEQLVSVFEPFVRAPGAAAGGLGLGLPIARALAEAHGGGLRLENRTDQASKRVLGVDGVLSLPADRVTRVGEAGAAEADPHIAA